MMSKKMKGISVEDVKAKLKHQTLLQDYQDLQKEVFDMRNRLEAAKGNKNRLLAEVRFLRRRYTYLLETKSLKQRQEQPQEMRLQTKLSKGGKKSHIKEATQFKLPPLPDLKHKGRVYAGKEGALRNNTSVLLGLNHNNFASSSMKEQASLNKNYRKRRLSGGDDSSAVQINEPAIYSSQNENVHGGISNGLRGRTAVLDLHQDTSLVRKEAKLPKQAPTFDLNEISMDEEVDYEDFKFESRKVPLVL